ncbi:hypothetical protein J18TS1_36350 [Oceanobacillus oncorhynchi subsp. incaldanensis]|nr:hypothetical protein J18TS1_36350 [Oceanobacillus oncorhynchi subsp. incaldanensis]
MHTYHTYEQIKKFLNEAGCRICGDSFEEYLYLMDGNSLNASANYVIKIMIEVEENN